MLPGAFTSRRIVSWSFWFISRPWPPAQNSRQQFVCNRNRQHKTDRQRKKYDSYCELHDNRPEFVHRKRLFSGVILQIAPAQSAFQ